VRCLLTKRGGGGGGKAGSVTIGARAAADGGGVSLQGAAVCKVDLGSPSSSISSILATAAQARVVSSTGMNEASSRSHAVIIAKVKNPIPSSSSTSVTTTKTFAKAKLALVDLAGSERASRANAKGTVAAEGRAINASLTALGKVVAALAEEAASSSSSSTSSSSRLSSSSSPNSHIPYRESSLTRVLRDCLDGSSRVAFLICASPAAADAREALGSLRFGSRARGLAAAVQASIISSSIPAPRTPAEEEETRREMQARKAIKVAKKTIGGITPVGRRGDGGKNGGEDEAGNESDENDLESKQAAATSPSPHLFSFLSRTQRGAVAAMLSAVQLVAVFVLVQLQQQQQQQQ
jgi:hypothetical protein